jgi:osmoprotectant transport system ATP-binding protein
VAVDEGGHLIGGVRADDVLEALSEQRRVPELG